MKQKIPHPVIAVVAEALSDSHSHAEMDTLFMFAGAPGGPPAGSKRQKAIAWLRATADAGETPPLEVLGKLLEPIIEAPVKPGEWGFENHTVRCEKVQAVLAGAGLRYLPGGRVLSGGALPTRTLEQIIRSGDLPSVDLEFERAVENIEARPDEAVAASCNILEAVCKTLIEDEHLTKPKKQVLGNLWKVVAGYLRFDPSAVEDDDIKKILGGMASVVDGIAALRTHASAAHGRGRKAYKLQPRHARLAVHASHTLTAFTIESWKR